MGFMTYFVGLVISGMAALLLRALVLWLTKPWRPNTSPCWQNILRPILRALPFAIAFAPTLLMKRGLGVLIPASVFLFPEIVGLPFHTNSLDSEDRHNLSVAATSVFLVWGISALIVFLRRAPAAQ